MERREKLRVTWSWRSGTARRARNDDGEQLGVALYRPEGACCANAPPIAINGGAVAVRPLAVVAERRERRGQGDSRAEAVARSGGGSSRGVAAQGRGGLGAVLLGACCASSAPLLLRRVLCGLGSRQAQASRWYGCDGRHGDGTGRPGAGGVVLNDGQRGEHPGSWSAWAAGARVRVWAWSRGMRGQGKKEKKEERRREKEKEKREKEEKGEKEKEAPAGFVAATATGRARTPVGRGAWNEEE